MRGCILVWQALISKTAVWLFIRITFLLSAFFRCKSLVHRNALLILSPASVVVELLEILWFLKNKNCEKYMGAILVPSTWYLVPDTLYVVRGTWYLVPWWPIVYKIFWSSHNDCHEICLFYKGVLALSSVVNYNLKCDATIWSVNLMTLESSFKIVTCLKYRPPGINFIKMFRRGFFTWKTKKLLVFEKEFLHTISCKNCADCAIYKLHLGVLVATCKSQISVRKKSCKKATHIKCWWNQPLVAETRY
jgi:hypothetical protein